MSPTKGLLSVCFRLKARLRQQHHFHIQTLPTSSSVMLNSAGIVVVSYIKSPVCDSVNDTNKTNSPYIQLQRSTSMSANVITQRCTGPSHNAQLTYDRTEYWWLRQMALVNYLILLKESAGKQKQILPRYCAYRSLIFRLVTHVGRINVETD